MRIHRWATREGARGIRSFARLLVADDKAELAEASCEAYIASGARSTGVSLSLGSTASVKLYVGVAHLFDVWLKVGSGRLAGWLYRNHRDDALYRWFDAASDRNVVAVHCHDGAVWWELWHPRHEWHSKTPRWRHGNFNPTDWVLGRHVYSKEIVEGPTRVNIPMPERSYPATVTIELRQWKRPRWPWALELYGYTVDLIKEDGAPGYIPVPGKGENSWDCGGDGTFSQSGPGRTIEDAITGVIKSALSTRRRRGSPADYAELIS